MNNNNDDDEITNLEVDLEGGEEEVLSEEDILLYSTYSGLRIFVLNNAAMTNILGVLLDETEDSFLVGLPAVVVEGRPVESAIEPFLPVPYTRLMKSAILTLMYTFGVYQERYLEYINAKGKELYPEIDDYIEEGQGQGQYLEAVLVEQPEVAGPENLEVSLNKDSEVPEKAVGMSDEELREYLLDKFNVAGLTSGSRKKQ